MILDKEKYIKVRAAQAQGARTVKEVKDMTGLVIDNDDSLAINEDLELPEIDDEEPKEVDLIKEDNSSFYII